MATVRTGIIAASVVACAVAVGATGIAIAEDNGTANPIESSATSEQGDGKRPALRDGDRKQRGGRHAMGILAGRGALHGEFVMPDSDGGFRTMVMQRGEVTSVSATEISVRSEDEFTATYAVTEDTLVNAARDGIETIEEGAEVTVVAAEDGDTATALRIGDRSAREQMRERFGLDGPEGRA